MGIVAAPVRMALRPIVNITRGVDAAANVPANTIFTIQKINNTYRVITGPEFFTFSLTIMVKIILFISITTMLYLLLRLLFRFIQHYLELRSGDTNTDTKKDKFNDMRMIK